MHYDALLATHEIMGMRVSYTGCYKITKLQKKRNRFRDRSFLLSNVIIQKQIKLGIIALAILDDEILYRKDRRISPRALFLEHPVYSHVKRVSRNGEGVYSRRL